MIALDSSAVIAIVGGEPTADRCMEVLGTRREVVMSAGTLTEVVIVATRRRLLNEVERLVSASVTRIIDLTPQRARIAAAAYAKFGKGFHPASLNFGDCFAYATAREFDCPLLYVGNDFSQTDVRSAIQAPSI